VAINSTPTDMLSAAYSTIPQMVEAHARTTPQKTAVICGDATRSWQELNENAQRISACLIAAGTVKGDAVAILSGNCLEYPEILLGILAAGAVAVPLSALLSTSDASTLLTDADVKAAFISQACLPQLDTRRGIANHLRIAIDFEQDDFTSYPEALNQGQSRSINNVAFEDTATIIYSSGTTGTPKGIVHSHLGRTWYAAGFAQAFHGRRTSVYLLTTGAYSNGSWGMMAPFFFTGGQLVIMKKYDVAESLDLIKQHKVTHVFLVPTQINDTIHSDALATADCSSLEMLISMGSYLRPELKTQVLERMTPNLYELYGCTEGVITLLEPSDMAEHLETAGRAIYGGDIRIVNDDDNEVEIGVAGEIVGWSPYLSRGYHNRPEQNEELTWKVIDGRHYIRTGDIGVLDSDGYVKIVGRKKEMIITGGYNVYPSDIEKVLIDYPGITDCVVAGKEDDRWGEVPYGFIIVDSSINDSGEQALEWANKKLSKHQRLKGMKICKDFPRNALGKVMKRELDFS
jgi:long-chain acyl-CoA synthetase